MKTILSLKQAPAETLNLLLEKPELAVVFWTNPNYIPPKTSGFWLWIARLFGDYNVPSNLPEAPPELDRDGDDLRLDDNWREVFTNNAGTVFADTGEAIPGSDHGYGDDRAVRADQVALLQKHVLETPPTSPALNRDHRRLLDFLETTRTKSLGVITKIS